ncbi:MAG: cysteine peptidase family C39 domain-containing protein [archaeon]
MKILDFPLLRQMYEYDCGANVLVSVLAYFGVEVRGGLIIESANTNAGKGTDVSNVLKTLKDYGLKFDSKKMTLADVKEYINRNIPVVILLQAWGKGVVDYANDNSNGHWVVAIGYGKHKIFFEDPYSFDRTFLTNEEFIERWHDEEDGKKILRHGIAVYGKKPVYCSGKVVHMD